LCALPTFSSGVCHTPADSLSAMLSFKVIKVPRPVYRSVRQLGVPPTKSSAVVALGTLESIFPRSDLNSSSVRSLVQHLGAGPGGGVHGTVHLLFNSVVTMLVVVCRSHSSWRQTRCPSPVKVTSHSTMPAPIRAPAWYASLVCSGNCNAAPRCPIEKRVR